MADLNAGHVPREPASGSAQGDKWSFCLTAGKIGPRMMREHEQETAPKPCIGLQGEGGGIATCSRFAMEAPRSVEKPMLLWNEEPAMAKHIPRWRRSCGDGGAEATLAGADGRSLPERICAVEQLLRPDARRAGWPSRSKARCPGQIPEYCAPSLELICRGPLCKLLGSLCLSQESDVGDIYAPQFHCSQDTDNYQHEVDKKGD